MVPHGEHILVYLLVSDEENRDHLCNLLKRNDYTPVIMAVPDKLLETLKGKSEAIVFLDNGIVSICGAGIYSKIKMVCQGCRIIVLCGQSHRDLIPEAMKLGAYGCILEPYPEWEVLTMVGHIHADIQPGRRETPKKKKRTRG